MKKLVVALFGFGALAAVEWKTLSDARLRVVGLAVLGLFAVLTWTAHQRQRLEEVAEGDRGNGRGPEAGGSDVRE